METQSRSTRPAWTRVIRAVAAGIAVAVLAGGCGGSGDDGGDSAARPPSTLLDPAAYAKRMNTPDAMVINVHIPYEGELEGTDAFIPFDKIVGDDRLPRDKDREILLYCRSGRMSQIAAEALAGEGYTNLFDLEGGMNAWEADGRSLVHREHAG